MPQVVSCKKLRHARSKGAASVQPECSPHLAGRDAGHAGTSADASS